jgi:hypothetical protein
MPPRRVAKGTDDSEETMLRVSLTIYSQGETMRQENEIPAVIDYPGTGERQVRNANQDGGRAARANPTEPNVSVELVVIDGPEGQKLHAIQAEVIHRILARLAERQIQPPQKESCL